VVEETWGSVYRQAESAWLRHKVVNCLVLRQRLFGLTAIATSEFVDLSCGVEHFLFAGIERMASRTDFNAQITASGGASLERVAAAASDINLIVGGMDFWLHGFSLVCTAWPDKPYTAELLQTGQG